MPGSQGLVGMAVLAVDGEAYCLVHRSVLDVVCELAGRLDCRCAVALGSLPTWFEADRMPALRRDLEQVAAFADAGRRTGWSLGELAVAPGPRPAPVLDTPEGMVWVHPARGFELHSPHGARRITEFDRLPGTVRRIPLIDIMAPLIDAASRAGVLTAYEAEGTVTGR